MERDVRGEGRRWTSEELLHHDELPGRLEMVAGKLCLTKAERILLLEALLEHVGANRAVHIGPLRVWQDAVALRAAAQS